MGKVQGLDAATGRKRKAPLLLSRRRLVQAGLVVTAFPAVAQANPAVPVERLHATILDVADDGAGFAERQARLESVVAEVFDFETMSRIATGAAWAEFSPDQRTELSRRFAAYAAANYARNFDRPSGIVFETLGTRDGDGGRTWVETALVRPEGERISFDYLIQNPAEEPRIVNIVVDGALNELGRRRSEFRALLSAGGIDGLLETLERQATNGDG